MKTRSVYILIFLIGLIFSSCVSEKKRWSETKLENSIAAYELFLEKYDEGEFSDSASLLLEELYYIEAKSIDSIHVYENFLTKYPEGIYSDSVRLFIKLIDYKTADSINTVEAYKNFIEKYPEDSLAEKSKLIIENFWIIKDIEYSVVSSVEASNGWGSTTFTPNKGYKLITLEANFSLDPNSNKTAKLTDIKLSGRYKDGPEKNTLWDVPLLLFGLGGDGSCSYFDSDAIIEGEITITNDAGYGIGFKKSSKNAPGLFYIMKNDVPVCLVFSVPEIPDDYFNLTFEYKDYPIKVQSQE